MNYLKENNKFHKYEIGEALFSQLFKIDNGLVPLPINICPNVKDVEPVPPKKRLKFQP